MYTFEQFVATLGSNHIPSWRFGQKFFNILHQMNPIVAERIRGTSLDPFYFEEVHQRTWEFVKENW